MSCLHEQVNATIAYSNTVHKIQTVSGIRYVNPKSGAWIEGHKDWPACYIGMTTDPRTWSQTYVYALGNFGPFYPWWEWSNLLDRRGLITNFQAVIDQVWAMSEDKSQPAERVRDLKDAWVQLQLADNKADAIRRLKGSERFAEVLGYLGGDTNENA